jgi:putative oxidoreductase
MKETPNAQLPTSNAQLSANGTSSNIKLATGRVRPTGGYLTSNIPWHIVDLIVGGIFIYAGTMKTLDPIGFASDIDNYKILPWTIGLGLAFYLPWLEIACGLAVVFRRLYLGGLSILVALASIFIAATVAAKIRGLDITCGCFGHVNQHWNFSGHLALDLAILGALLALALNIVAKNKLRKES